MLPQLEFEEILMTHFLILKFLCILKPIPYPLIKISFDSFAFQKITLTGLHPPVQ